MRHQLRISTWCYGSRLLSLALFLCSIVLCHAAYSQTAHVQEIHLKHFVLIFRATRTFTPEELKQRPVDIAAWVKQVTEMGIKLDPRNLGETAANFSKEGDEIISHEGPGDPKLATMVFFDAASKDQAVNIARMHPGLRYGVTVEVREWTSPAETAARQ